MAQVNWKTGASGDWWLADDWDTGAVPTAADAVTIGVAGSYTVNLGPDPSDPLRAIAVASLVLSDPQATLDIAIARAHLAVKGVFTNAGTVDVDAPPAAGGSTVAIGTLENSGTFNIGAFSLGLAARTVVKVQHLDNTGYLYLYGGAGNAARAILEVTGDMAPAVLAAGSIGLTGPSLLVFAGGEIGSIASGAQLWLDGPQAFIADAAETGRSSALTGLFANAGELFLGDGAGIDSDAASFVNSGKLYLFNTASFRAAHDFTNSNLVWFDPGFSATSLGGTQFAVGGTLHNTNSFAFGIEIARNPDHASVGALDNSGTLLVGSTINVATQQAFFSVTSGASNTGHVSVSSLGTIAVGGTYRQTVGETAIDGALSASEIRIKGGTLHGSGTLTGGVVLSGGTIASDDGAAALSIHGRLVDHAAMDTTLGVSAEEATRIAVDGDKVALKGATLNVHFGSAFVWQAGETYTVLTFTPDTLASHFAAMSDGTHSGDGNSLDLGNGFALDATYDNAAGDVTLTLVATEHAVADAALHAGFGDGWV